MNIWGLIALVGLNMLVGYVLHIVIIKGRFKTRGVRDFVANKASELRDSANIPEIPPAIKTTQLWMWVVVLASMNLWFIMLAGTVRWYIKGKKTNELGSDITQNPVKAK